MRRLLTVIACHLLVGCCWAVGQEPTASAPPDESPEKPAPKVLPADQLPWEVRPSIIVVPDKAGKQQMLLDWTYERVMELWKLQENIEQPDRGGLYTLQELSVEGAVSEDTQSARLTAVLQIEVRDEGWVPVPLRLNNAKLLKESYQGGGQHSLRFEADGRGYVCWLRGEPDQTHELTLEMVVGVQRKHAEHRLALQAPQATISKFTVTVPGEGVEGAVSEGATLESRERGKGKTTVFTGAGLRNDFELRWAKPGERPPAEQAVIQAVGTIVATIDSREVRQEAVLKVQSFRQPLPPFRVRLPAGSEWVPGDDPVGYTITPVETLTGAEGQRIQIVEVEADEATEQLDVRLSSRQRRDDRSPIEWFQLAGFEVVEARRQWGEVTVEAIGDWRVSWDTSAEVEQVDTPEGPGSEDVVAAFQYARQPCSLIAQVTRRKTRIRVEPEYLLVVGAKQVELQGKLTYHVRGDAVSAVQVHLPGWQLVDVGPVGVAVMPESASGRGKGDVWIPLTRAMAGTIEVEMSARRPTEQTLRKDAETGETRIELALPYPGDTSLKSAAAISAVPAVLAVLAEADVELVPNAESTKGLTRQPTPPYMSLLERNPTIGQREREPLFYRVDGEEAAFGAGFRTLDQQISVGVASQVVVPALGSGGEVIQVFSYTIAHKPATRLSLLVPGGVAAGKMEVDFEGQSVTALETDPSPHPSAQEPAVVRLALPAPVLGQAALAIRYPLDPPEEIDASRRRLEVPLVMPGEGNLVENQLRVVAERPITPVAPGGPWTVVEEENRLPGRRAELALTADRQPTLHATLEFSLDGGPSRAATVVERAWVQSWVTTHIRQDRAVFRFTSNEDAVELVLPEGALAGPVELRLDRQSLDEGSIPPEVVAGTTLRIALPVEKGAEPSSHCLEVRYHLPTRPPTGVASLDLPHLGPDVWIRWMYWELVLPENEHLVAGPEGFTPESEWDWTQWLWQRRPLREQPWLETWSGARPGTLVPEKTNRYLFSVAGTPPQCSLVTAHRSTILLVASGAVLAVGLLLIYIPFLRHPAWLLLGATALAAASLVAPGPAVLVAQAASLGLVLALLAALLKRLFAPPLGPPAPEPASSVLDMGSTQTQYRTAAASRPETPETAESLTGSAADANP